MSIPFPDWLEPMAATLTQERFTGPEWVFERKYDGIRCSRSSTATTCASSRAIGCHSGMRPSPPQWRTAGARCHPRRRSGVGWHERVLRVRHPLARGTPRHLIVGGFTDPQGARVGLGALLVGHYQGSDFVFAGKIGTGFDTRLLLDLRRRLDAIEIPASPFTKATHLPRLRAHWVRPEITVTVGFIEWTVNAKLRHPRLLEVRL